MKMRGRGIIGGGSGKLLTLPTTAHAREQAPKTPPEHPVDTNDMIKYFKINMLSKKQFKQLIERQQVSLVIGIDPDADRNGVATLSRESRQLTVDTMTFPDLLDYLRYMQAQTATAHNTLRVIIEAGWLNKTHWHVDYNDSRQAAAAKGNAVGRNHETGRKIAEMCAHWGIAHELIKPLSLKAGGVNLWHGKDGKISAEELTAITGLKGRTNQEARDAALLAWVWAGLPTPIVAKN